MSSVRAKKAERFSPARTGDKDVDRNMDDISKLLNGLLAHPLRDSYILDVTLAAGVNRIPTGRKTRGFFVMVTGAGILGDIYDAQPDNPHPDRELWVGNNSTATDSTLLIY